ncbi:oligosaccharide biosynthesis protein Alg14 like protein [Sarocladium strictum]
MGSGGHTKEMLMMMDDGTCDFAGFHRRYLISSGDTMSLDHVQEHEREIRELCSQKGLDPGSYDTRIVTRARRVHQPLWTTPFTSILSIIDIFPALLSPPKQGSPWPQRIYSNGPATGFFVAVVAHFLRVFFLAPEASMRFLYIESWARISTLSLTGKLLHYTGLADVFVVQHNEVGERYGIKCVGQMVFNSRRTET